MKLHNFPPIKVFFFKKKRILVYNEHQLISKQVKFYNIHKHHLSYYQMHDQLLIGYIQQFQDFYHHVCGRVKKWWSEILEWNIEIMKWNKSFAKGYLNILECSNTVKISVTNRKWLVRVAFSTKVFFKVTT